jgi:hypothetical protein
MPTSTFAFFDAYAADVHHGVHNLATNQLVVALTNTAPDAAGDAVLADITQITYTNISGNPTSRQITTVSSSQTGGTYKLAVQDQALTASGGSFGPFRYAVVYNDTPAGDPLIGWVDYGAALTVNDGEPFNLNFSEANGLFQVAY